MTQLATITSKKQLTLPSKVFKKAGLRIGQKVIVSEEDGHLLITPAEKLVEELAGSVSTPARLKGGDIDKVIELSKEKYFRDKYKQSFSANKQSFSTNRQSFSANERSLSSKKSR